MPNILLPLFWLKSWGSPLWINYAFFSGIYVLWKLSVDLAVRNFWSKKQGKWTGTEKSWILKITPQKTEWPPFVYALKSMPHRLPQRTLLYNCRARGFPPIYLIMIWIWKWERKAKGNFLPLSPLLSHREKVVRRLLQSLRWEVVKDETRKEGVSKRRAQLRGNHREKSLGLTLS